LFPILFAVEKLSETVDLGLKAIIGVNDCVKRLLKLPPVLFKMVNVVEKPHYGYALIRYLVREARHCCRLFAFEELLESVIHWSVPPKEF